MVPEQQQDGEAEPAPGGANVGEHPWVNEDQNDAMESMEDVEEKIRVAAVQELNEMEADFISRAPNNEGRADELKREGPVSSPRTERNEELKSQDTVSCPRVEKNEERKDQANLVEELRTGGNKGKGSDSVGRGGKGAGGRSSKTKTNRSRGGDGANKGSPTIGAAGLPSMRRTRSQPGRARGGGEREEIYQEPVQEKEKLHREESLRRDRRSNDIVANWAANWAAWVALVKQWVEKQEPRRVAVRDYLLQLRAKVESKVKQHWPLARAWLILITRVMLMLSLLGLEAAIRGFASLFRLGSAAHFLLLWCTVISFIRLAGLFNLVIALVLAVGTVFLAGCTPAFAMLAIFGALVLWLYGSFWLTGAVIITGGALFAANQGRLAVSVTVIYAVYSILSSGGWFWLLVCIALSFISSDLAVHFLSPVDKDENFAQTKAEHTPFSQQKSFNGRSSDYGGPHSDTYQGNADSTRSSAGASTSGANEGDPLSAEEEVARVLSCSDHYAILGFARYEALDASSLKREYRKKAIIVHPDKNGGNDQAEEAFKRLQNAYEVLLDAMKKKTYDEELRREEILMTIRRHHVHANGRNGAPDCGCKHPEDDGEDLPANSRRISCRKCGNNHAWISTSKTKLRARWCQECQDHHPAKDGDGWVEQTVQAFFFGMFQKGDIPHAYACADGMVYEVTEWVLCQGLKCQPNTHKPSFHVNTSGIGKSPTTKPRSGRDAPTGADGFPFPGFHSNMTEQEFFDWVKNNSSNFTDMNGGVPFPDGSPFSERGSPAKPGSATKTRGKKKKGKKQW